jgi:putative phage-type endonuclease
MTSTLEMTREEWLAHRRTGIGGSDVAGILGLSPWKTPLQVYLDKTGEADPVEENDAMYWGNVLEAVVAEEFAKRTGLKVRRRNQIFRHKQFPFLLANIDRDIVGADELLECKTTSGWNKDQWGEQGTDQIPFPYLCQVMHYLSILGYSAAHVAVLIDGRDFRIYRVPRNEELIATITDRCIAFWLNHVAAEIPPAPTSAEDLQALYSKGGQGGVAVASVEIEAQAKNLASIKGVVKNLEADIEAAELAIKTAMGEAAELVAPDGSKLATWKATSGKRLDTKAIQAAEPELCKKYTKETTGRTFLLKVK